MNQAHKEQERIILDRFLAAWEGRAAIASLEQDESPDVTGVLASGKRLGLEIVTVTDERLAEGQSLIEVFTRELDAALQASSLNVSLVLGMGEHHALRLRERAHREQLVARLVQSVREEGGRRVDIDEAEIERRAIDGIDSLGIFPEEAPGNIYFARTLWGRTSVFVQECITGKDAMVEKYRRRLGDDAELWLLLVAGSTLSNGVAIPAPHLEYDTSFDHLFFLDCWTADGKNHDRMAELRVRRPR